MIRTGTEYALARPIVDSAGVLGETIQSSYMGETESKYQNLHGTPTTLASC